MRIAELERQTGLSRHTVRYYEVQGLIAAPPRQANNYREYPAQTVSDLRFIREAQRMGFQLAEIRSILQLRRQSQLDCAEGARLLQDKLDEVDERLRQLQALRRVLRVEQQRLLQSAREQGLPLAAKLDRPGTRSRR